MKVNSSPHIYVYIESKYFIKIVSCQPLCIRLVRLAYKPLLVLLLSWDSSPVTFINYLSTIELDPELFTTKLNSYSVSCTIRPPTVRLVSGYLSFPSLSSTELYVTPQILDKNALTLRYFQKLVLTQF